MCDSHAHISLISVLYLTLITWRMARYQRNHHCSSLYTLSPHQYRSLSATGTLSLKQHWNFSLVWWTTSTSSMKTRVNQAPEPPWFQRACFHVWIPCSFVWSDCETHTHTAIFNTAGALHDTANGAERPLNVSTNSGKYHKHLSLRANEAYRAGSRHSRMLFHGNERVYWIAFWPFFHVLLTGQMVKDWKPHD